MMRLQGLALGALAVATIGALGCGSNGRGDDGISGPHIVIAPPDVDVTVTNNVPVAQAYTATLIDDNGDSHDVTSMVSFSVANPSYGNWSGPTLSVTGGGAGVTQVIATNGTLMGSAKLTVHVIGSRDDGTVPAGAGGMFDGATETGTDGPTIAYPENNVIAPPNLGQFDVHWRPGAGQDLFEISLQNQYVNLKIHKAATGPAYSFYLPAEWTAVASTAEPITLTVSGMNTASPGTKSTSEPHTVGTTNEIVQGGLYYWTTSPPQGIFRYDMSTPDMPPSSFFPANMAPGGATNCVGCHTLSKDGTKIAMTIDGGDGRGAMFDVADRSILIPFASNPQSWNFATFNTDNTKLVTVSGGQMVLRSANGAILTTIPNTSGQLSTHPELSPDSTRLASVDTTGGGTDYDVTGGSIVTRTFDDATNSFGPAVVLVPNANGASNFYPSWSPDGQWILFTRTTGRSYADPTAEVWVVRADGSAPPIQLVAADTGAGMLRNSWARWTPFVQSYGADHQSVFFVTFSSTRPFGVRGLTNGTYGPDQQIWMAAFFPDKANGGMDPSAPAIRMPFQDFATSNHIAQWTQAVIIGRYADGTPMTQAQAQAQAAQ